MDALVAALACTLLGALAFFQLALALGAPWGRLAWGGQHDGTLPARLRVGSAVSIGLYALFAAVLLDRAGMVDLLPAGVSRVAAWVLFGYGVVGVAMNAASRSRAERLLMTPVALVLAACSLVVALG